MFELFVMVGDRRHQCGRVNHRSVISHSKVKLATIHILQDLTDKEWFRIDGLGQAAFKVSVIV